MLPSHVSLFSLGVQGPFGVVHVFLCVVGLLLFFFIWRGGGKDDMDEFYNLFNRDSILMCFGQLASIGTWEDEVI